MDAIHKAIGKIEFPKNLDGFLKSDLQNQLVVGGIAGEIANFSFWTSQNMSFTDLLLQECR